jgi:hypothetical protein
VVYFDDGNKRELRATALRARDLSRFNVACKEGLENLLSAIARAS